MRALITGAGGFVGRWLATELLAAGQQVFGLILPGGHPPAEGVPPICATARPSSRRSRKPRRMPSTTWPASPREAPRTGQPSPK